jgi:hypothetical protein
MIVKATDSGVRYHRPRDTDKDVVSYFFRALVDHEGEEKLISAWASTPEVAKMEYDQKIKQL